MSPHGWRELEVPEIAAGWRLDHFLAQRFPDRTRSWLSRGIRNGQVLDDGGRPLRSAQRVRAGQRLRLLLPGIAPSEGPPPFPPLVYEDQRVAVVSKPAGLLVHPSGTRFTWSLVGLAKARWPQDDIDLVHRLDRDTSGVVLLSKDREANRSLKQEIVCGRASKTYLALCKGEIPWEERLLDGPIGPAEGPVRIQMAVRADGLAARTRVRVLDRRPGRTLVRCELLTGRTHQIRVHLHHAGYPLFGDRLYGVAPEVFLRAFEQGADAATFHAAGAPRQALHAWRIQIRHPDGGDLTGEAPLPADLQRWLDDPSVLPLDGASSEQRPETQPFEAEEEGE